MDPLGNAAKKYTGYVLAGMSDADARAASGYTGPDLGVRPPPAAIDPTTDPVRRMEARDAIFEATRREPTDVEVNTYLRTGALPTPQNPSATVVNAPANQQGGQTVAPAALTVPTVSSGPPPSDVTENLPPLPPGWEYGPGGKPRRVGDTGQDVYAAVNRGNPPSAAHVWDDATSSWVLPQQYRADPMIDKAKSPGAGYVWSVQQGRWVQGVESSESDRSGATFQDAPHGTTGDEQDTVNVVVPPYTPEPPRAGQPPVVSPSEEPGPSSSQDMYNARLRIGEVLAAGEEPSQEDIVAGFGNDLQAYLAYKQQVLSQAATAALGGGKKEPPPVEEPLPTEESPDFGSTAAGFPWLLPDQVENARKVFEKYGLDAAIRYMRGIPRTGEPPPEELPPVEDWWDKLPEAQRRLVDALKRGETISDADWVRLDPRLQQWLIDQGYQPPAADVAGGRYVYDPGTGEYVEEESFGFGEEVGEEVGEEAEPPSGWTDDFDAWISQVDPGYRLSEEEALDVLAVYQERGVDSARRVAEEKLRYSANVSPSGEGAPDDPTLYYKNYKYPIYEDDGGSVVYETPLGGVEYRYKDGRPIVDEEELALLRNRSIKAIVESNDATSLLQTKGIEAYISWVKEQTDRLNPQAPSPDGGYEGLKTGMRALQAAEDAVGWAEGFLGDDNSLATTISNTVSGMVNALGFDPAEEKRSRRAVLDADFDEARERISRQFAIDPEGALGGGAQRSTETLERERMRAYSALDAEIAGKMDTVKQQNLASAVSALSSLAGYELQVASLEETSRQFNLTYNQTAKQYARTMGLDEAKFLESARQWDTSTYDQRVVFATQMGLSYQQLSQSVSQFNSGMDLERDKLLEAAGQWNTSTVLQRQQFAEQLGLSYDQLKETARQLDVQATLDTNKLNEMSRQYAGTLGLDRDKFSQAVLEWDVSTDTQRRQYASQLGLSYAQLKETVRQANLQFSVDKAGLEMEANKLNETARQFDETLVQRVEEFAKTYGLNEMQTQAVVKQIYTEIGNSTRQVSAQIGQGWAEILGFAGTESGTLGAQDLGVQAVDPSRKMLDAELRRRPEYAATRGSYEALTGTALSDADALRLLRGESIQTSSMPTMEARKLAVDVTQGSLERIAKYDAIAKEHGLDTAKFNESTEQADRAWDLEIGNIASAFGMDNWKFRGALMTYEDVVDVGESESVAATNAAASLGVSVGTFLQAKDQFDIRYGNALKQQAHQLGISEEQYVLAQRSADRVDRLQVATLASTFAGAQRHQDWYLEMPPEGKLPGKSQEIIWATKELDGFFGEQIKPPTTVDKFGREISTTYTQTPEQAVEALLSDESSSQAMGDMRQRIATRIGAFATESEWQGFLVNYVAARRAGSSKLSNVTYLGNDWYEDMDPNVMNALLQIAGMSPAAQYAPVEAAWWESLVTGVVTAGGQLASK